MFGKRLEAEEARYVLAAHAAPEAVVPFEAFVEILCEIVDRPPVELPTGEQEEVGQDGEGPGHARGHVGPTSPGVILEGSLDGREHLGEHSHMTSAIGFGKGVP